MSQKQWTAGRNSESAIADARRRIESVWFTGSKVRRYEHCSRQLRAKPYLQIREAEAVVRVASYVGLPFAVLHLCLQDLKRMKWAWALPGRTHTPSRSSRRKL